MDEVFNIRLRRGKVSKRKAAKANQPTAEPLAATSPQTGGAPVLETPVSAPAGGRR